MALGLTANQSYLFSPPDLARAKMAVLVGLVIAESRKGCETIVIHHFQFKSRPIHKEKQKYLLQYYQKLMYSAFQKSLFFWHLLNKTVLICAKITYVESATMLFFNANRYDLQLSNELLFIIIAQGATKLWPINVGGLEKYLFSPRLSSFLLGKKRVNSAQSIVAHLKASNPIY